MKKYFWYIKLDATQGLKTFGILMNFSFYFTLCIAKSFKTIKDNVYIYYSLLLITDSKSGILTRSQNIYVLIFIHFCSKSLLYNT